MISKLPFWFLYRISDALFYLLYFVVGYRRKVVQDNLAACFPQKSEAEIRILEMDFYRHLCDVAVETIKLISISPSELKSRIRHENPEFAQSVLSTGGSYIAMASHMNNWEWLLAGNALYLNGEIDAVYKPLHNAFFEKLMRRIRSRFGAYPVPSDAVLRMQISRKGIPKGIAMASDQTPGPESSVLLPFMGRRTYFFKGPPKLARKLGFPLFYAGIRKEARGKYVLFVEPMENPAGHTEEEILADFARRLEREILLQPAFWLWSHRRWKHAVPASS